MSLAQTVMQRIYEAAVVEMEKLSLFANTSPAHIPSPLFGRKTGAPHRGIAPMLVQCIIPAVCA